MYESLWNNDSPVKDLGLDVPSWFDQAITPCDFAAVCQGGCESGAYMPAVTYHEALAIMSEHGDNVLDFIEEALGEVQLPDWGWGFSWSGLACHFLSVAVELWCGGIADELEEILEDPE